MADYVFKRRGGPLVKWNGVAPPQARAADAVALGCADPGPGHPDHGKLGLKSMGCACKDTDRIPKPGAPEYISGVGDYVAVGDAPSTIAKIDDAVHSGPGRSVAMAANLYHGYKRNGSVGWALAWAALGYAFPVVTTVIATAQGFGKPR